MSGLGLGCWKRGGVENRYNKSPFASRIRVVRIGSAVNFDRSEKTILLVFELAGFSHSQAHSRRFEHVPDSSASPPIAAVLLQRSERRNVCSNGRWTNRGSVRPSQERLTRASTLFATPSRPLPPTHQRPSLSHGGGILTSPRRDCKSIAARSGMGPAKCQQPAWVSSVACEPHG